MKYDYRKAMYDDIEDYIFTNMKMKELFDMEKDEAFEKLYDEMWVADSVTGNGSGSYTFNAYEAEELICHNFDLWEEACEELGQTAVPFKGAETADVTIRCYLLGEILSEVLDDLYKDKEEILNETETA